MIRVLKNITASELVLTDFQGVTLAANAATDGLQFGSDVLRNSVSVNQALIQNELEVSDGFLTFTGLVAIDLLRGNATQVTKDGKQIYTSSDRPKDFFRYYTSKGDNLTTGKVGEGNQMTFFVPAGDTHTMDVQFIEDMYAKDGQAHYHGVEDHCHVSVEIVCPAGVPFPATDSNGNYDLIGPTWTANANGTGAYFILGTETTVFRFVQMYPLVKDAHYAYIESAEPQFLPAPYIIRTRVMNDNATNPIRVCFVFGMYRKLTIN